MDWSNPKEKISQYFTVREALLLPSWDVIHVPNEAEKAEILATAKKMDLVREFLGVPVVVHCWLRPLCASVPKSKWDRKNYNAFVGGAPGSAHAEGKAVDFHPQRMTCGEARQLLVPKLSEFGLRMENKEGNWVHIDTRTPPPNKPRFFRP